MSAEYTDRTPSKDDRVFTYAGQSINVDSICEACLRSFNDTNALAGPVLSMADLKQEGWAIFLAEYRKVLHGDAPEPRNFRNWAYTVILNRLRDYVLRFSVPVKASLGALRQGKVGGMYYLDQYADTQSEAEQIWGRYTESSARPETLLEQADTSDLLVRKVREYASMRDAELVLLYFGYVGPTTAHTMQALGEYYGISVGKVHSVIRNTLALLREDPDVQAEWEARGIQ